MEGKFHGGILIGDAEKDILREAWGVGDHDAGLLLTPEHRFSLNSLGNMFTAIAIMQLVEQGRLGLDDPLSRRLSEFEHAGQTISRSTCCWLIARVWPTIISNGCAVNSRGAPALLPFWRWRPARRSTSSPEPCSVLALLVPLHTIAQQRPPISDMHLHAAPAAALGPPPRATCTPMPAPAWDPGRPYTELFTELHKESRCPDPVWSPMTDNNAARFLRLSETEIAQHHGRR